MELFKRKHEPRPPSAGPKGSKCSVAAPSRALPIGGPHRRNLRTCSALNLSRAEPSVDIRTEGKSARTTRQAIASTRNGSRSCGGDRNGSAGSAGNASTFPTRPLTIPDAGECQQLLGTIAWKMAARRTGFAMLKKGDARGRPQGRSSLLRLPIDRVAPIFAGVRLVCFLVAPRLAARAARGIAARDNTVSKRDFGAASLLFST